jgi:hypothetical protein
VQVSTARRAYLEVQAHSVFNTALTVTLEGHSEHTIRVARVYFPNEINTSLIPFVHFIDAPLL